MNQKKLIKLLIYELKHIVWLEETIEAISKSFAVCDGCPNVPSYDYEIYKMVLDILKVPPDEYMNRDIYFDLYINFYRNIIENKEVVTERHGKKLFNKIIKLRDRRDNEC